VTLSGSGIHVREPGLSSGGVEITIPTSVVAVGDTLEILTSPADQASINALIGVVAPASPQLDVDAGAVADLFANPIAVDIDNTIFLLSDSFAPFILSASYDSTEGFQLLTFTFNENIDVSEIDLSLAFISGTGVDDEISLFGAAINNGIDGNPISLTLTNAQDAAVDGLLTTPQLDVHTGAFPDLAGNDNGLQLNFPLALTPTDLSPPNVLGAEFDPTFGILRITFDEDVDTTPDSRFDQSLIDMSAAGGDHENSLTGATLVTSSDSDIIEIELTTPQITTLNSLIAASAPLDPELDFDANAFQDSLGNANDGIANDNTAISTIATDTDPPEIDSITYDQTTGFLTITFVDDDINLAAIDLGKIFVSLENKKNQISLSGAFAAFGLTTDIVILDTNFGGQQGAINDKINLPPGGAPHAIQLDVGKNAFTDGDGNRSDKSENNSITVT